MNNTIFVARKTLSDALGRKKEGWTILQHGQVMGCYGEDRSEAERAANALASIRIVGGVRPTVKVMS